MKAVALCGSGRQNLLNLPVMKSQDVKPVSVVSKIRISAVYLKKMW